MICTHEWSQTGSQTGNQTCLCEHLLSVSFVLNIFVPICIVFLKQVVVLILVERLTLAWWRWRDSVDLVRSKEWAPSFEVYCWWLSGRHLSAILDEVLSVRAYRMQETAALLSVTLTQGLGVTSLSFALRITVPAEVPVVAP
jgi:hypothetical protein